MLFDLRGRGRRRTIQVIYLSLAILMGGGLVLFGIGGDVQGGLFDAFREDSGRNAGTEEILERVDQVEQRAQANPRQPEPWAELARLRYQAATISGLDEATGQFSEEGRAQLEASARAWERYLSLEPENPDANVANIMTLALGPGGLNRLDDAVGALEIVAAERDNANLYAQLAVLSYQAGQERKGDLAKDRALELAESRADRETLREQIEQARAQQAVQEAQQGQQQGGAGAGAGAGGAAPPPGTPTP